MGQEFTGNSQSGPDLLQRGGGGNPEDGAGAGQQTPASQGQTEIPKYHEQFTDDLKGHESLTKFKDLSALGNGYLELEGKMGNMISIPGDEASDEDRAAFYTKLGRPETADGYELTYGEGIPEYLKRSLAGSEESLKQRLFKAGVSNSAANEIFGWMQEDLQIGEKVLEDFKTRKNEEAITAMRSEWGEKFDENKAIAELATRKFLSEEDYILASNKGLTNDPTFIRLAYAAGLGIKEDTLPGGSRPNGSDKLDWGDDGLENL